MKIEQQIFAYKELRSNGQAFFIDNYEDADRIIEVLEKQIPKEPYFEGDGYYDSSLVYDTWRCPNCDSKYEIEFEEHEYCPHCGQAIKWE